MMSMRLSSAQLRQPVPDIVTPQLDAGIPIRTVGQIPAGQPGKFFKVLHDLLVTDLLRARRGEAGKEMARVRRVLRHGRPPVLQTFPANTPPALATPPHPLPAATAETRAPR